MNRLVVIITLFAISCGSQYSDSALEFNKLQIGQSKQEIEGLLPKVQAHDSIRVKIFGNMIHRYYPVMLGETQGYLLVEYELGKSNLAATNFSWYSLSDPVPLWPLSGAEALKDNGNGRLNLSEFANSLRDDLGNPEVHEENKVIWKSWTIERCKEKGSVRLVSNSPKSQVCKRFWYEAHLTEKPRAIDVELGATKFALARKHDLKFDTSQLARIYVPGVDGASSEEELHGITATTDYVLEGDSLVMLAWRPGENLPDFSEALEREMKSYLGEGQRLENEEIRSTKWERHNVIYLLTRHKHREDIEIIVAYSDFPARQEKRLRKMQLDHPEHFKFQN